MDGFLTDEMFTERQQGLRSARDRLNRAIYRTINRIENRTDQVLMNATTCLKALLYSGARFDPTYYDDSMRRVKDLQYSLDNILNERASKRPRPESPVFPLVDNPPAIIPPPDNIQPPRSESPPQTVDNSSSTTPSQDNNQNVMRRKRIDVVYGIKNDTYDPRVEFHGFRNTVFRVDDTANVYFHKWYCKSDKLYKPDIGVYEVPIDGNYRFHLRVVSSCLESTVPQTPPTCQFMVCFGKSHAHVGAVYTARQRDMSSGAVTEIRGEKEVKLLKGDLVLLKAVSSIGRWYVEEGLLDLLIVRN